MGMMFNGRVLAGSLAKEYKWGMREGVRTMEGKQSKYDAPRRPLGPIKGVGGKRRNRQHEGHTLNGTLLGERREHHIFAARPAARRNGVKHEQSCFEMGPLTDGLAPL